MTSRYQLIARDRYPFTFYDKRDRDLKFLEYLEVYKFIPKPADSPKSFDEQDRQLGGMPSRGAAAH